MGRELNRRHFLSAAAGSVAGIQVNQLLVRSKPSANERLHVGVIGVAGQGQYDWARVAAAGAEIVALCDVDERRTAAARNRFPKAKFYSDFRKLIDQKGIDAVIVATPDHMHADERE